MAVYDRWHRAPRPGDQPCAHRDRKGPLYPNSDHGQGIRWQVRWIDEDGKQRKRSFEHRGGKKTETDPEKYAEAFDAKLRTDLNSGNYTDPSNGEELFESYARQVITDRTIDEGTREKLVRRMEIHVYPEIGGVSLKVLARRPTLIQGLVKKLERNEDLAPATIGLIMAHVTMVFSVAVEDNLVSRNPCQSKAVVLPTVVKGKIVPWTVEQLAAVREQLAAPPAKGRRRDRRRFAAMVDVGGGLGLRQGEIFALSPDDDIDWLRGEVTVQRQVKLIDGQLVFALPKGEKIRSMPLPEGVKLALAQHMRQFPPVAVTLPWRKPDGPPRTVRLFFTTASGAAVRAANMYLYWREATIAAGIAPAPTDEDRWERGNGMHTMRHHFASLLITEGEAIHAVSEWLGHASIQITLDLYTHLMPKSTDRMRRIIDAAHYALGESTALIMPSGAVVGVAQASGGAEAREA